MIGRRDPDPPMGCREAEGGGTIDEREGLPSLQVTSRFGQVFLTCLSYTEELPLMQLISSINFTD